MWICSKHIPASDPEKTQSCSRPLIHQQHYDCLHHHRRRRRRHDDQQFTDIIIISSSSSWFQLILALNPETVKLDTQEQQQIVIFIEHSILL